MLHHASSGPGPPRARRRADAHRESTSPSPRAARLSHHPPSLVLLFGGPIHLAVGQHPRTQQGHRHEADPVCGRRTRRCARACRGVLDRGWKSVLVVYALPYYIAAMAGVWLSTSSTNSRTPIGRRTRSGLRQSRAARRSHLGYPRSALVHRQYRRASRAPCGAARAELSVGAVTNPVFHASPVSRCRRHGRLRPRWDEERNRLIGFRDVRNLADTAGAEAQAAD